MTREELKAALRAAADDYKRATDEVLVAYAASSCSHDWMQVGGPGDEWRECYLCGKQEDLA